MQKVKHPYQTIPDFSRWRLAIQRSEESGFVEFPVKNKLDLGLGALVGTAGSCFAERLAERLPELGLNFYVAEKAPDHFDGDLATLFHYGRFSARYGNLYTSLQLRQLLDRALKPKGFVTAESPWIRPDGAIADPFRPLVEPHGFGSEREMLLSRKNHLEKVVEIFRTVDCFIFTLGLTESWISLDGGEALPICPGVVAGSYDPQRYQFKNLTVSEVIADLESFVKTVKDMNPRIKFCFTVSPVPLIATCSGKGVIEATTYSKSVLRVAAEDICGRIDGAEYFPSFEIIQSSYSDQTYFEPDMRSVTSSGVDHVMHEFAKFCNLRTTRTRESVACSSLNVIDGRLLAGEKECDEKVYDR